MPGKQHFFAIFPRKLLSFINARLAWEMAYSHAHGNKLASCHESWFFSSCRMHSKPVFSHAHVLHLQLPKLIMRPPSGQVQAVMATPAKHQNLERNCIPLRLHPGLARFVAALAKLRFRAFPSKSYTKYLMES